MKVAQSAFVVAMLFLAAGNAPAQFVKGNEAVTVMPNGAKKVDTPPPTSAATRSKPCAADAGCHAGSWHMVETEAGLRECTEAYARAGTCRASTYGDVKRSRLWVVKSGGIWRQCQFPDLRSKCVDIFARPPANLPFDAVQ